MKKFSHSDLFKKINQHEFVFLMGIAEPSENSLLLEISEGIVSDLKEDLIVGEATIEGVSSVDITNDSATYYVEFDHYVAYSVLDESYTVWDEYGKWEGHKFRVYTKSHFLEYISKDTFADDDYPGPYRHYALICENHIVHIASCNPPTIKRISPSSSKATTSFKVGRTKKH